VQTETNSPTTSLPFPSEEIIVLAEGWQFSQYYFSEIDASVKIKVKIISK